MSTKLMTLPNGKGDICWRRVTQCDLDVAKELLRGFKAQEPLRFAIQPSLEDAMLVDAEFTKACINDGHSICAYESSNHRICGMFLTTGPHTATKSSNNWSEGLEMPLKMAQLFRVLDFMAKGPDKAIATRVEDAKYMMGEYLMVHAAYRRIGLGEALCKKSWEVAKEQGCKFFFSECTSSYTDKIFNKHGAETLKVVDYSEYRDCISGERVLAKYPEPHSAATLVCMKL